MRYFDPYLKLVDDYILNGSLFKELTKAKITSWLVKQEQLAPHIAEAVISTWEKEHEIKLQ